MRQFHFFLQILMFNSVLYLTSGWATSNAYHQGYDAGQSPSATQNHDDEGQGDGDDETDDDDYDD